MSNGFSGLLDDFSLMDDFVLFKSLTVELLLHCSLSDLPVVGFTAGTLGSGGGGGGGTGAGLCIPFRSQ